MAGPIKPPNAGVAKQAAPGIDTEYGPMDEYVRRIREEQVRRELYERAKSIGINPFDINTNWPGGLGPGIPINIPRRSTVENAIEEMEFSISKVENGFVIVVGDTTMVATTIDEAFEQAKARFVANKLTPKQDSGDAAQSSLLAMGKTVPVYGK
jgi:hypothetical protein